MGVYHGFDYAVESGNIPIQTGYLTVIDTFQSFGVEPGDSIVMLGENGRNCGALLEYLNGADTIFVTLSKQNYREYGPDTLYLQGNICGRHYLRIKNGKS